ncbi:MAG TPA: type II toxin-antitoxin system RelE/ParE family toxin [Gammaproteobacteria bacterium]|nr:type II toxin-antitoxin system RelE/ParE family toxin [Gammaproteobacteria bacterium]
MIKSFRCKETLRIFNLELSKKLPRSIQQRAYEKLRMLHNSKDLNDLRVPPANNLEKLKGDRAENYSIRINKQWRICFKWTNGIAEDVEIIDYH